MSELPATRLTGLTLGERGVSLSGDVVELCMRRNVPVHFVDNLGNIIAVVQPPGGSSGEISLLQITDESGKWFWKDFYGKKALSYGYYRED